MTQIATYLFNRNREQPSCRFRHDRCAEISFGLMQGCGPEINPAYRPSPVVVALKSLIFLFRDERIR